MVIKHQTMIPTKSPQIFFLFFFSIPFTVFSNLSPNQTTAITTIATILTNNSQSVPWNNNNNPCSWPGVSCSSDNSSITSLSLSGFGLSSSDFLSHVCKIESLQSLDVSNNRLTRIPDEFFLSNGCQMLKALNFSKNQLVGSLPLVRRLTGLESLDLSFNSLSGDDVGGWLDGLVSLKRLNLGFNEFGGEIPLIRFRNSIGLEEMILSGNLFRGEISKEIGGYEILRTIDFSQNQLSGEIPDEIRNLTKLEVLVLSSNNLSGQIPPAISGIRTLTRFAAHQNWFTGPIPNGLTRFLTSLDLSYNRLTGSIPDDLLSYPRLTSVDLSSNKLQGSIPSVEGMSSSSSLFRLRLGGNLLNGTIPESFGSLRELTYLELDHNRLSGAIPAELGSCRKLALLDLSENELTGVLPGLIGGLTELQVLRLQNNRFVGSIPEGFDQLLSLFKLNISWNSLDGSIPDSLVNLGNLTHLALQGNRLSGVIPVDVGKMVNLIELELGQNQLVGTIPDMPVKLQIALNLSSNHLQGNIPEGLWKLRDLEILDLSNNQLSVNTTGNDQLVEPKKPDLTPKKKSSSVAKSAILAATLSAILAVSIVALVFLILSRRVLKVNNEVNNEPGEAAASDHQQQTKLLTCSAIHSSNLDFFKAMEAVSDPGNVVVRTRFCTYYKATMPSGARYLVKKLNLSEKIFLMNNYNRFSQELVTLARLSNSNVMSPLAYSLTEETAYLFYENAPLGCLFDVLQHRREKPVLDWPSRYSIAVGVAQGLASLHGFRYGPILLLDMSSKNVLLKSLKEPVVGDIELCKVIDPSKSTGSISTVAGSVGYIPPEYAYTMRVTMAGNVYSFGVILLELVTGKPAVSGGIELAKWAVSKSKNQAKWDEITDSNICGGRQDNCSVAVRSQMLAVLKVALSCVGVSPDSRPKMKSVLRMILNAR
ncbi:Leucine-rich repeat receptor-like tyrosine-protein kinase PXC3 [Linum grandiflorum]